MDEFELISTLQSNLSSALPVPAKTSGMDDERPVPVVIIDDWDTDEKSYHNSAFAGDEVTSDGYERYLNFDFTTRVEFLVRHSDEVDAVKLKDKVTNRLRLIGENPEQFHDGLKNCLLGDSGNPTYQFTEPKEAELMLSARFKGDHTVTLTESDLQADTLEAVENTFTFNP
jgi:hypothetical protein